ncbi:MAG: PA2169 family four-helix-bundle protein [Brevundimonas sp.]|jgi:uncharacterized protein (TIGR02284 family)|uniref:PA2169 family four-helix-bundle protein n=1 Tax=unclassified Brevundimonas TaxID=2622653 RepID=UPI0010728F0F|nr:MULTISPECIES: PA2169 family four-helix-bundle protein [unclassified Brevundimonas]QBX36715.1 PA2169 family four-helix-bundle protein [Brevundimonas sp. MF30-B]TFW04490.1 PA2169 family four-helix-bundle protein [Brevundimonas sp. S30B]
MSNPNDPDIKVLNGLIETTLDSVDGYREAAKETDNSAYRALFERRAEERAGVASDLQACVRSLGGDPEDDGSILAKAHRAFLDIKHALLRNEQSVVDSVEAGEDHIKAKYERALEDTKLSATTRETVRRAYAVVKTGHDQMRDLKHSLESRSDADSPVYPT